MSDPTRYSTVAVVNHWTTAFLVGAMLLLGFLAAAAPDDATGDFIMGVHTGLGFFVALFVFWRVGFRLYEGFVAPEAPTAWERRAASVMHRVLVVILLIQVLSGPLYIFTEGEAVDVFGWFTVAIPLGGLSFMHEAMEWIHVVIGLYLLPALLVVHILGAVRHYRRVRRAGA